MHFECIEVFSLALWRIELREKIAPLLGYVFETKVVGKPELPTSEQQQSHSIKCSMDVEWLVFDFTSNKREPSPPVVLVEKPQEKTK